MKLSFGGRDNSRTAFKKAKVSILPIPYGRTVTYKKGTEKGPFAILDASDNMELFDEELKKEIYNIGITTIPYLKVQKLSPEKMISVVENQVSYIFKENKMPVLLGGEHSITIPAVLSAKKVYKDISILYFDAHYDLKDKYNGSKYNHACVARRLKDIAPIVEVGVRSLSKEEKDFLPSKDVKIINMSKVIEDKTWIETVKHSLSHNVYISIDLDVFDPSIMPSVGTPEPGGMMWYPFLNALKRITSTKNIVGFDVVELCPIKDFIGPDFMAAKLVYKLLGYIYS